MPIAATGDPDLPKPMSLIEQCQRNFEAVNDYTAVFIKHQRIRGRLRKPETIFVKFKKPFALYMKWIKTPDEGKEVIYVDGKNDNKLLAHAGGILNWITPPLHLRPESPLAMSGNLKPITQAGLGAAVESLLRVCQEAEKAGDLGIICKGKINFEGREVFVVERYLPEGKGYPHSRTVVYVDQEFQLPIYYAGYNHQGELIEEYIYRDLKLNVGLTEHDFDPGNPEYEFKFLPI